MLQTQETARGLIVNMSDVLFDTSINTISNRMPGRSWPRFPVFCSAYPGLTLQVEGYTDNVGSDEYNQTLSQQRADAVRDYLISQGVSAAVITATGYGMSNPIADNSTTMQGRAQNRRVQMVVSGQCYRRAGKPAVSREIKPRQQLRQEPAPLRKVNKQPSPTVARNAKPGDFSVGKCS